MRLIIFIFFFGCLTTYGQTTLPEKDGKIVYEQIDSSVIAKKDILYTRAKSWIAESFKSANAVIQLDDVNAGKIIAKGNALVPTSAIVAPIERMDFTLEITVKDDKYRLRIYDIGGHPISLPSFTTTFEKIYDRFNSNDYPHKTKREEKWQKEQKEKDKTIITDIDAYITYLMIDIKKGMKKQDDF